MALKGMTMTVRGLNFWPVSLRSSCAVLVAIAATATLAACATPADPASPSAITASPSAVSNEDSPQPSPKGVRVSGTVLDAGGSPLAACLVHREGSFTEQANTTDEAGKFVIWLPQGRHALLIMCDMTTRREQRFEVEVNGDAPLTQEFTIADG